MSTKEEITLEEKITCLKENEINAIFSRLTHKCIFIDNELILILILILMILNINID